MHSREVSSPALPLGDAPRRPASRDRYGGGNPASCTGCDGRGRVDYTERTTRGTARPDHDADVRSVPSGRRDVLRPQAVGRRSLPVHVRCDNAARPQHPDPAQEEPQPSCVDGALRFQASWPLATRRPQFPRMRALAGRPPVSFRARSATAKNDALTASSPSPQWRSLRSRHYGQATSRRRSGARTG
jgi:hypothetical protein